ncbi:MAG: S1 RNA-binding domain-containing protein [Fuerstiella sp.]|nr:S1 RNA-binding domain-containing protein [Fuerstiella sp.]
MTTEDHHAADSGPDETVTHNQTTSGADEQGAAFETDTATPQMAQASGPSCVDPAAVDSAPATPTESDSVPPPIEPPVTKSPDGELTATVPADSQVSGSNSADPPLVQDAEAIEDRTPKPGAAARVREQLRSHTDDHAVQISDDGEPRQERSQGGASVEIPKDSELDSVLESQIAEAMTSDTSAPVETAPIVGSETETEEGQSAASVDELGPGSQLKGTVQQIHGDNVFVDAGVRSGVIVPLRQFAENKQPSVGDELTIIVESVDEDGLFKARIPQGRHKPGGNWDALAAGQVVDCMVTGTNKGGLQVTVSSLRGFMPASQVDLGYIDDLEVYVGQKLTAQIMEVNKKKRNLVLSRRVLLQAERASQQGDFWASLEVGQDHEGTVKTIKDYGVFVDLGPMDGFLHIGEMAWSRINHPNAVVSEGQTVQVKILKLDAERQRISLGMKQLIQNPWLSAIERYAPERVVAGKVTRIADFGAFVELEPGIEGLVHISELAWRRVGSVSEVLSTGDSCDFQVIDVDPKRKRISLSLKALETRPEQPAREERPEPEERKPNPNLRGGTSAEKGGSGLFGNPSDFT